MLNLDGSVSYIFLIFGWFLFLIFPICYGLRFLNFQVQGHLYNKNLNNFTILLIATLLLSDLNGFFFELAAFSHHFENTNVFISNAIHFLVVDGKTVSDFEKNQWVVVSYDCRI